MKYREIEDPKFLQSIKDYLDEHWKNSSEYRLRSWTRITNYLFILNTGGLVAISTYAASKTTPAETTSSFIFFTAGTLLMLGHAATDYYLSEHSLRSTKKEISSFYDNKTNWQDVAKPNPKHSKFDIAMHVVGAFAALCFLLGLLLGIKNISSTSQPDQQKMINRQENVNGCKN